MGADVQAHVRVPWQSLRLAAEPGSGVPGRPLSWFQVRDSQPQLGYHSGEMESSVFQKVKLRGLHNYL